VSRGSARSGGNDFGETAKARPQDEWSATKASCQDSRRRKSRSRGTRATQGTALFFAQIANWPVCSGPGAFACLPPADTHPAAAPECQRGRLPVLTRKPRLWSLPSWRISAPGSATRNGKGALQPRLDLENPHTREIALRNRRPLFRPGRVLLAWDGVNALRRLERKLAGISPRYLERSTSLDSNQGWYAADRASRAAGQWLAPFDYGNGNTGRARRRVVLTG